MVKGIDVLEHADNVVIARKARLAAGITTTEAAELTRVVRRTWEMWESGSRAMPTGSFELFILKLAERRPVAEGRELLVVYSTDEGARLPIDVIPRDGLLNTEQQQFGISVISSISISREGRPYIHKTYYSEAHNKHVRVFIDPTVL